MSTVPMKLFSSAILDKLASSIEQNVERYRSGDFSDLSSEMGWEIETRVAQWDPALFLALDPTGTPEAEVNNSLLIYQGFHGMSPALAREERLWSRLCHVEFLEYARKRWLTDDSDLAGDVKRHFFAAGMRGCRDQNAIGRLWWNGHLAALASPENVKEGLTLLLARANIRLQIVDRAEAAFRQPLIRGIFRLLRAEAWFRSDDSAIANFMYEVNKRCGGLIFEAMEDIDIDDHLAECLRFAKLRISR